MSDSFFSLEMRMVDPRPTYEYLVTQLVERTPNLAYVHVIEPGIKGNVDSEVATGMGRGSQIPAANAGARTTADTDVAGGVTSGNSDADSDRAASQPARIDSAGNRVVDGVKCVPLT